MHATMTTNALIENTSAPCGRVTGAHGVGRARFQVRPGAVKCVKVWCGGGKATASRRSADGFCRFITTFSPSYRSGVGQISGQTSRKPSESVMLQQVTCGGAKYGSSRVKVGQTCGRQSIRWTFMNAKLCKSHNARNQPLSAGFRPKSHLAKSGQTASVAVRASSANSSADFPQYLTSHPV